jgi:hypothetical protein
MTDAEGRAAFTDLSIDGEGGVVLRFSCCEVAPTEHPLSMYLGAAGNVLGLNSPQRFEARAGTTLTPGPSVNLVSELFLPVEGAVVHFSLTGPGSLPVTSVTSNAEGIAELPSFVFHDRPGTSLLHASLETGQRITFVMKATADGKVELLRDGSALVGEPGSGFVAPSVLVTYGGVPQSGVTVEFLRSGGSGGPVEVTALTDASGKTPPVILPLSPTAGVNVYEAWAIGYSATPTVLEILGVPGGGPLELESSAPADVMPLEDAYGATYLSFRVVSATGAPVMGIPIRFSEEGEAGVVEWWDMFGPAGSGEAITDELGSGVIRWLVPWASGTYRIRVSSPASAETLAFTAVRENFLPLRFETEVPANALALENSAGMTLVTFRVVNASGAPVPGVRISWTDPAEGFAGWWTGTFIELMGPFFTDPHGRATLAWTVPKTPGTRTLTVTSPDVPEPITFTAIREE